MPRLARSSGSRPGATLSTSAGLGTLSTACAAPFGGRRRRFAGPDGAHCRSQAVQAKEDGSTDHRGASI
eukprot:2750346-Pyramimonas_sp.AAC.1